MKPVQLFAPADYVAAPEHIRAIVVNGCGPGGWKVDLVPDTIYGLSVRAACNVHDWMYAVGADLKAKEEADRVLLNNLLRLIAAAGGPSWLRWLRRRRARTYYEAVQHFGGPAFWAEKNDRSTLLLIERTRP